MAAPQIYNLDSYLSLLNNLYPRLWSQIDRDPDSPTYGSCDRGFWMYRLHDFDSGVLQQASLTLAALAALADEIDLSPYLNLNPQHKAVWEQLARAINRRTVTLLSRNGMLDEYYPGEQSFPGTIFTSYATLKSALMLKQDSVVHSDGLRKTASQFLKRGASPAANQDVAAAAFLALYSNTLHWKQAQSEAVLEDMVTRPQQEGYFMEYGGMDVGYSTVTLNYLGYIHADNSYTVEQQFDALATMLADFITPAGYLGGEFASRSTTYFLPFGFLQAAYQNKENTAKFAPLNLSSAYERLDDRYLMHYCLPALAMGALNLAKKGEPKQGKLNSSKEWQTKSYPQVQLYALHQQDSAIFLGLNKGGALQIEHEGKSFVDTGYRLERDGKTYATCVLQEDVPIDVGETDTGCRVQCRSSIPALWGTDSQPLEDYCLAGILSLCSALL